jgi:4-hydroxy-2-oxoglutarate aldolase
VNLDGILPPIATPFRDDDIDLDGLRANVSRWMKTGLRGLVLLGTNGEAPYVTLDEVPPLVEAVREGVPEDRVLIVGTGKASTRETIQFSRAAAAAGADAVLVLTPASYKPLMSDAALEAHYEAVADASPVPVVLYNMPAATGVNLTPRLARRLATHPNIAGMKDSSGDLAAIAELGELVGPSFQLVVGSAMTLYASLLVGALGGVVAVANVIPDVCLRLHACARQGLHAEALALQRAITPLARAVTTEHGVPGLKVALDLAGYRGGAPRRPLAPAGDDVRRKITELYEAVMVAAGS